MNSKSSLTQSRSLSRAAQLDFHGVSFPRVQRRTKVTEIMALLYFFDSTAKFPGLDYDSVCSYFCNAFLQTRLSEKGAIKHFWKV